MEGSKLLAGQSGLVQFHVINRLVAGPKDPFILRSQTPPRTIGGGRIIEAMPRRLRRTAPGTPEDLAERAAAVRTPAGFLEYCVKTAAGYAVDAASLGVRAKLRPQQVERLAGELIEDGQLVRLASGRLAQADVVEALKEKIAQALERHHERRPASPGLTGDELREGAGLDASIVSDITSLLVERGELSRTGDRFGLAGRTVTLSPEEQGALDAVEGAFREGEFAPPSVDDVRKTTGLPGDRVDWAVRTLEERGVLVSVARGLMFHAGAVGRARELLTDYIRREGSLESVKFKYLLDTTRKYAIPLLDYFDRVGVTLRRGYTRYLRDGR
jgi:selenocysteine-specific elongation factor